MFSRAIFSNSATGFKFTELHALTLATRSYALLALVIMQLNKHYITWRRHMRYTPKAHRLHLASYSGLSTRLTSPLPSGTHDTPYPQALLLFCLILSLPW